ncbi:hypothetical protein BW723_14475 [Polaribacter reichenbachii]|uniref:Uncharacterized protein n=2 Tax=Polaribacter reichenbachii TaxID=996801 RepID=A0A1B8U4A1_9FLAO|nr:hypothetical protein BW723_14475 [Polaribacter reichenbachii]AUC18054.1 hypothetical protein BTO17_04920 [Polaribacter reichenbachii]OBY66664.1 hypothetical protein LPB301_05545 [Polaribacter reichenbachii]
MLFCCKNSDTIITEPIAFTEFYINNQTDTNLSLEIVVNDGYTNGQENESVLLNSKESEIFYDLVDMSYFRPEEVLKELKFYATDVNSTTPILTLSTITNTDWEMINNANTPDNSLRFELTITNDDLN